MSWLDLKMVIIFLVMKLFQKGYWVTVQLSHEMLHVRHAMVSKMPDGLRVQLPPPPGKLAAQLKLPFAILVYHVFITCSIYPRMYVDVQGGKGESWGA